ncbi:Crp/Fnr family transcriptional regulator [Chitinophaga sp.]|uniref:Crp/Fnr family transcriptional regulator n=1 Tax=Chitinophaga sp. TaxID=1869181 RepID=UPI0031D780E9
MDWKGRFETQSFREGDLLFAPGGICRHLYFINQGIVRIMSTSDKGDDITHYFLKENYFCTILGSFFEQVPALEGIQAATDVEVSVIGKDAFNQLVKEDEEFKKMFDLQTTQGLLQKIRFKNMLHGHDATTRYRLFLEKLPDIAARVPLGYIASYLGITQQSLSRIRKNLPNGK